MSFPLDQLEDKYEILGKLREGGMGAIYKVRHRVLDDLRVIKVMLPSTEQDASFRQRFLNEARTAVNLRNDNLVVIYDCRIDDAGRAFIVMEYIDGLSLRELVDGPRPIPLAVALELSRQGLAGLRYLHRKGIVHRDISPDNLMVCLDEAGTPTVKLIDLGIAKAKEKESGLTDTGVFIGKFRYCSPEQFGAGGSKAADERCDLYAFGIVMYELLTSRHPFPGSDGVAVIAAHLYSPPLDFAISDPEGRVPEELRQLVLRALAKRPADRWQSAAAMLDALPSTPRWSVEQFRELLGQPAPEPAPPRPTTTATTHGSLRRGRHRTASGRQRTTNPAAAARRAPPPVVPTPRPEPRVVSGPRLTLPPFVQPLCWPARGLPGVVPFSTALAIGGEPQPVTVSFRSGRLADVVAVAVLELFTGRNLVELANGRAVLELVTHMDRAGLLTAQITTRATGSAGRELSPPAALEGELNRLMIRSLRTIRLAVEPTLAPLLRVERRQVALRMSPEAPALPVCGWLVPLADGAPQPVELFDRASGEPLSRRLPEAAVGEARIAVLHEQRLVVVAFELAKAASLLSR